MLDIDCIDKIKSIDYNKYDLIVKIYHKDELILILLNKEVFVLK